MLSIQEQLNVAVDRYHNIITDMKVSVAGMQGVALVTQALQGYDAFQGTLSTVSMRTIASRIRYEDILLALPLLSLFSKQR
jgi:hypothetical protein